MRDLHPPHPLTFEPGDPNTGRSCIICGHNVPQGCRYVHQAWCIGIKRSLKARDTHAETLRVLLLREATEYAEEGANDMLVSAHEAASFGGTVKHCRTRAGVSYAMAGIALILALMIGGE